LTLEDTGPLEGTDLHSNKVKKKMEDAVARLMWVSVFLTAWATYYLYHSIPKWIRALSKYDSLFFYKVLVFAVTALIGLIFFQFKRKQQRIYGVCETTFALTSTWLSSDKLLSYPNENTYWIALISSIYLIVRGLTNINEANAKDKEGKQQAAAKPPQ